MEDSHSLTLVVDIVIIIVASLLFGVLAHKLRQSVILAYILVGILIGPYGFGLISNIKEVTSLAEIGVALLM
jgi:CPA2 family monovalent cation:H+ antiporter-2